MFSVQFGLHSLSTFSGNVCRRLDNMKANDVLLCLSLEEQRQSDIHDRLTKRGHVPSMAYLRKTLRKFAADGLVVMRKAENGGCFYRLAEGEAVEAALDSAWDTQRSAISSGGRT